MNFKRLIFLILLSIIVFAGFSQPTAIPDSLCKIAYHNILSLKFDDAKNILNNEIQHYPQNLYVDYLENYMDFLSVFISENEKLLDSLEENKYVRLSEINRLPDSSPYKKLMLANINLQWAFARSKFEEFFTAALEINRAYRLIKANNIQFPNFVPNNIALGVMHIIIGLIPDQYHWILTLISMDGTVEQGKAELYKVLEKGISKKKWTYLAPEALFYLGFIELNLSANKSALEKLSPYLNKTDTNNLMMCYLKTSIYMNTGQNDSALSILTAVENKKGYFPFYYLYYLHAECLMRQLNPEADLYFHYYLSYFHGRNYIKSAWRYRALIAVLNNDTKDYYRFTDSVLTHGYAIVDADINAQKEAEKYNPPPNTKLLEVRFLFDGGYYKKALGILNFIDTTFLNDDEKLERLYRYGRIYHLLNHTDKAVKYYLMTINRKENSLRYFAANAALKLGQLYESNKQWKNAEKYYTICLDMDFDEYRNSIRGKAKDGLERIENKE